MKTSEDGDGMSQILGILFHCLSVLVGTKCVLNSGLNLSNFSSCPSLLISPPRQCWGAVRCPKATSTQGRTRSGLQNPLCSGDSVLQPHFLKGLLLSSLQLVDGSPLPEGHRWAPVPGGGLVDAAQRGAPAPCPADTAPVHSSQSCSPGNIFPDSKILCLWDDEFMFNSTWITFCSWVYQIGFEFHVNFYYPQCPLVKSSTMQLAKWCVKMYSLHVWK